MRFALGVVGLGLLLVLLVVGAFVGSAMLLAGMAMRLWRGRGKPTARRPQAERVVEGEYRLVGKPVLGGDKGPALPLGR